MAVQDAGDVGAGAAGLAGQAVEGVVGRGQQRPQEGLERAAQRAQQRLAVGVLAVDDLGELVAQALDLVGLDLLVFGALEGAIARAHHQSADLLHQVHGVAQRGFGLRDGVALRVQRALLGLDAADACERALGLRGGHGIVARAHHPLARGHVLLQSRQRRLPCLQVAHGAVVHVGRAHAVEGAGHGQRPIVEMRLSNMVCAICSILAEAW
jgi:hypothetical protein